MEDRFREKYTGGNGGADSSADELRSRMQRVLAHVPPIFDVVDAELANLGIDRHELFDKLGHDSSRRLERAINKGRNLAAAEAATSA